jgi:hypothetical protein
VSHPSLGLPPVDRTRALPPGAARLDSQRDRLTARALEIAIDRDPTIRDRYDEVRLRQLLRDTAALFDRIVEAVATDSTDQARVYAEAVPPAYRRRKVPMDDLINLTNSLREAIGGVMSRDEMGIVDATADAMIEPFRWHRRIAGDARKRNRLLQAIYKGA